MTKSQKRFKFQPPVAQRDISIEGQQQSDNLWRINQPCAIQARQSSTKQVLENRESSEAQTKDHLEKVLALGWKDNLITVFIEGDGKRGVSGRLRIDERPGLNALLDGVYNDTFKTIFTWNESRLFRDEFMIGPDTFIKACYDHDVIVATRTYRYDFRRNPFDMDLFRMQCQIAARWIKDHVFGYMIPMRERVGKRGQYYTGSVPIGYILDKRKHLESGLPNPNYNRFIPYEPHAKIVQWIFKRYRELGGNIQQLGRELVAMPFVFPPFEAGIKIPNIKLKPKDGGYTLTRSGLIWILTNVVYIGYWKFQNQVLRDEEGTPVINHPPIVDTYDFWYAFNQLSQYTIDGEINEGKERAVRYDQEGKIPSEALLKMDDIIKDVNGKSVYTFKVRERGKYRESYGIRNYKDGFEAEHYATRVDASMLDNMLVERMFEHLEEWKIEQESGGNIGASIYEGLQKEEPEDKPSNTKAIDDQLALIEPKIAHYERLIEKGFGLPDEKLEKYGLVVAELTQTQKILTNKKNEMESKTTERTESKELVDEATERWNKYRLDQKRRVIRFVVHSLIIERVATSWLKVEIIWKGLGDSLPTTDTGYLWLPGASNTPWTDEETQIVREMYPYGDATEIITRLPNRAWKSIIAYASRKEISRYVRKQNTKDPEAFYFSVNDRRFMEEHNIDLSMHRRGTVFWTDSETFLPVQEDDSVQEDNSIDEIDDITGNEDNESQIHSANKVVTHRSTTEGKRNSQTYAAADQ